MASRLTISKQTEIIKTPKAIMERRKSVRIEDALPFKIGHASYDTEAVTINVGCHGAMCLVDKEIPLMTQLNICLTIPVPGTKRTKQIKLKGVVVRKEKDTRTKKFFVAIYFSEVKEADQKIINNYIDHRLNG